MTTETRETVYGGLSITVESDYYPYCPANTNVESTTCGPTVLH